VKENSTHCTIGMMLVVQLLQYTVLKKQYFYGSAITIMTPLDNFYLQQPEPHKSCLLALRNLILSMDKDLSPAWKYSMPFFCYKGKMFCYLWVHKKQGQPYIGIVEGTRLNEPELIAEKRSRMKILLLDPHKDLPVKTIRRILHNTLQLYKKGVVSI
jgi:hypothetical protein